MWRKLGIFLPVLLLAAGTGLYSAEATREMVQAAYLYRFLEFVEFPSNSPGGPTDYCLCVIGDEKLSQTLTRSVQGKLISGRSVMVRSPAGAQEAKACQLLFLTGRKSTVMAELSKLQSEPILIVSDIPDAQNEGGVVTLNLKDDRMHFEINVENAKKHKLLISSRLIQLSRSSQ